ncbi:MAG: DUF1684 domain-containing protein, partial [Cyclobacteriaceae bacterium]
RKWIYGGAILIIILSVLYNFIGGIDPESYRAEILEAREETDRFMRFSEESPFKNQEIPFDSLKYFEPDLSYRVAAMFRPIEKRGIISLATNDGKEEEFMSYGYASFTLDGIPQELLILENIDEQQLFVPFGDATSAEETYGAGRYLDVEHGGGATIVLDFNKAYNPYCAYVDDFTCPLPPRENLLTVPIPAGEKSYH